MKNVEDRKPADRLEATADLRMKVLLFLLKNKEAFVEAATYRRMQENRELCSI